METCVMRRGKNFVLTKYLESDSEMAVITSRLFLSLHDWPRNPSFDMDMSYTRVLHIKVAYRVPHK
jgi:hypothetical protein